MSYQSELKHCAWCGRSSEYMGIDEHHYYRRRNDREKTIRLCRECHNLTETDNDFFLLIQSYAKQREHSDDNNDNEFVD